MVQIYNAGGGNTNGLTVNTAGRALTASAVTNIIQHINDDHAAVFTIPFDAVDPVGADDYFLYIKNNGSKSFHIVSSEMRSTVIGTVELHSVTGTVSFAAEAAITPVNKTVGSSNSITATTSADTNATGLTSIGILEYSRLAVANTNYLMLPLGTIIIPPGQSVAYLWDTASGILSGTVTLYEDQDE